MKAYNNDIVFLPQNEATEPQARRCKLAKINHMNYIVFSHCKGLQ